MRIVERAEFLTLPPGTVFCKYRRGHNVDPLEVKGETIAAGGAPLNDFFATAFGELFAADAGFEYSLEINCGTVMRDGSFDGDDVRFVVLDDKDKLALTKLLWGGEMPDVVLPVPKEVAEAE